MLSLETASTHLGSGRVYDMASDWTELSSKLNLASLKKDGTKDLLAALPEMEATKIRDVMEFRKTFLTHLIRVGLPITTVNTGHMGFKWQSGVYFNLAENRIPLNFLPPNVYIFKNGKRTVIPLVRYNKRKGTPIGLTKQGRQLLTKFSEMRGA